MSYPVRMPTDALDDLYAHYDTEKARGASKQQGEHVSTLRGHAVYFAGARWRYTDNDQPTVANRRPCGNCGLEDTEEGHDGCLGTLPGVLNACCGHGEESDAYVQLYSGLTLRGRDARLWQEAKE